MRINADFDRPVLLRPDDRHWIRSPEAGVDRQMLDRIGDEIARATSLVRYIPGSVFKPHRHDLGEEFLVLEGSFADEHGRYPAGTYVRNPPGTSHRPDVPDGCTIFVKLRQFDPRDLTAVTADLTDRTGYASAEAGVTAKPLHAYGPESVSALILEPGAALARPAAGGAEYLVLDGGLTAEDGTVPALSWGRIPDGGTLDLTAGPVGARLYLKTGHLPPADA